MSKSETGSTGNSFIDRQKALLAQLDAEGIPDPPLPVPGEPSTPPAEPPAPQTPSAAFLENPPAPDPSPTGDPQNGQDSSVADIQARLAELQHQLASAQGRLAPTQNQLSALQSENAILKQQIAGLQTARGSQAQPQPPAAEPPSEDDPELQEFQDTYGDMIPGLNKFVSRMIKPIQTQIAPVVQQQKLTADQQTLADIRWEHTAPVREKYPKVAEIVGSKDFQDYVNHLPVWARDGADDMFRYPERHETSKQIAFLDEYTRSRGQAPNPQVQRQDPDPSMLSVEVRKIPTTPQPQSTGPVPLTPERLHQINKALTRDRTLYTKEQIAQLQAELDQGELVSIQQGRGLAPNLRTLS